MQMHARWLLLLLFLSMIASDSYGDKLLFFIECTRGFETELALKLIKVMGSSPNRKDL